MKTLLTILCLLPLLVFAQSSEPFKKANTIVIQTGLSPEEAFQKWGRYLVQSGFTLADTNKDFLTISTGPKDTSKMNFSIRLDASISENGDIVVKPKWQQKSSAIANTRASEFYDWRYRGMGEVTTQDILATVGGFGSPVSYSQD
jgi:hypothetical protein